ncbi:MAG: response regulator transcription factor [Gemmatimonadetes bacterium]|nr:response regulator transcription factor [Gemmatimonadota bacterium]
MQILIADQQVLVRRALRSLLEGHGHQVVAEADSGAEAIDLAARQQPDLVLLDLHGAPAELLAAARVISMAQPRTAVVVLAGPSDDDLFLEAVAFGARGFVTRDLDEGVFCSLLNRCAAGEIVVSPSLATRLLEHYADTAVGNHTRRPVTLTPREHEMLARMTSGQTSNRELAESLGLSENTVRFHMRNILEKFHVHRRAAVVAYAFAHETGAAATEGPTG